MKFKYKIIIKLHSILSFLPLVSFLFFLSYIFRVIIKFGELPKYHKQESFSYFHNEVVWAFLFIGYLSPILWFILTLILKNNNIIIGKRKIIIWIIGMFSLFFYLLLFDQNNLLGWFVD